MGIWKEELDEKYERIMNAGIVSAMDEANNVVLDTIDKLNRILKDHGI